MKVKSFKEVNFKNEQKFISYLMRNSKESLSFNTETLLNTGLKCIAESIKKLTSQNLTYTHDELLSFIENIEINKEQLEAIYNAYDNFENIEFIKDQIRQSYLKTEVNKQILEEILIDTTKAGDLDVEKLKSLGNYLLYNISEYNSKLHIKTTKELADDYKKTLEERENGFKKRSLGFVPLNKGITRPAHDGEMTGLISFKGMGKSIFKQSINNILINSKIPVLDLDLEMIQESTIDRKMCIRGGFSLNELLRKEKDEKLKARLYKNIELFKRNPYYHYINEPGLTLDDLDAIIFKSKIMFRESGILSDNDEYIFVSIDLLEMIKDFSEQDYRKLIPAINKLHEINKRHGTHILFTLQANENKIRSTKFDKPDDLDYYKIGLEDVYGSSVYAGRARVILSLQRPKHLRYMFFPERMEEWDLDEDIINCHCIKQNDGSLFFHQYVFGKNFKIVPRVADNENL